jgi:hypothetical protein
MDHELRIQDVLKFLIKNGPGRTEVELADAIFGESGYQQRVNVECGQLLTIGRVERRGAGGPGDPYRYYARD